MKQIIWGFWGCGKSEVADGVKIVDTGSALLRKKG